jgi:hypothetical protein
MTAAERFASQPAGRASQPPGRMESHAPHEELEASDPEVYRLNVEFVHSHGVPRGQITTFSTRVAAAPESRDN